MSKINIKDLYIAEVGRFQFYKYLANNPQIEYKKLKSYSFYFKDKNTYVDIFSGDRYCELQVGNVQKDDIGLVEPKKYDEMFLNSTVKQIEQDPMFSIEELKIVTKEMKKDVVFGSIQAEKILLERILGKDTDMIF